MRWSSYLSKKNSVAGAVLLTFGNFHEIFQNMHSVEHLLQTGLCISRAQVFFLVLGTGPPYWFPICIYRPWLPICVYQPWPQTCITGIYRYWSLKLYLPTLDPAMAPNLYFPVQVKILPLLPQPLVLSLPLLLPAPLLLQLLLLLPLSLLLIIITIQQTHDVVSTSIRRLCDFGDVVQTSYRR